MWASPLQRHRSPSSSLRLFRRRAQIAVLLGLCLSLMAACATREVMLSRPAIGEHAGWRLVEACAYRGCYPPVDDLLTHNLTIRVRYIQDLREYGVFRILLHFSKVPSDLELDPSRVQVNLANGKRLVPKVLDCKEPIYAALGYRPSPTARSLIGPTPLRDIACIGLHFDGPPPPSLETFVLHIEGLTRGSERVKVPDLVFRPRIVKEPPRLGFFQ
jgi:hypothetical protein